jgi:hypothetical protein
VSTLVPPLFAGLVDDASVMPPSFTGMTAAVVRYREQHGAWFSHLLGELLVPSSLVDFDLSAEGLPVGVVSDVALGTLPAAVAKLRDTGAVVRQVEAAVARRGEDPQPGLAELCRLMETALDMDVYAEIPLSWGLLSALDAIADSRRAGTRIAPKFRVGGLAAELFPTPVELAAVICACRDRDLSFKLAAGLQHALRHTDPETGFTHHGFLNVLVAAGVAADGGEVAEVAEALAATHPLPLVEPARARRDGPRPLWVGFGATDVLGVLTELIRLGLINGGFE